MKQASIFRFCVLSLLLSTPTVVQPILTEIAVFSMGLLPKTPLFIGAAVAYCKVRNWWIGEVREKIGELQKTTKDINKRTVRIEGEVRDQKRITAKGFRESKERDEQLRTYSEGRFDELSNNNRQASQERASLSTQLEQQSCDLKSIQEAVGEDSRIVLQLSDLSSQVKLLMTRQEFEQRFKHADSILDQLRTNQIRIQNYITQGDLARDIASHLRESTDGSLAIEDSSSVDQAYGSYADLQYGFPVDSILLADSYLQLKSNSSQITCPKIPAALMEDVE